MNENYNNIKNKNVKNVKNSQNIHNSIPGKSTNSKLFEAYVKLSCLRAGIYEDNPKYNEIMAMLAKTPNAQRTAFFNSATRNTRKRGRNVNTTPPDSKRTKMNMIPSVPNQSTPRRTPFFTRRTPRNPTKNGNNSMSVENV